MKALTKAQKAELESIKQRNIEGMRQDAEQGHWLRSYPTTPTETSAEQAAPDQTGSDGRYPPHFARRSPLEVRMKDTETMHKVWAERVKNGTIKPKGNQDK